MVEYLPNKHKCSFKSFDVVEFYPSRSKSLLERGLDFAAIADDDRSIILEAKQSVLFNNREPWHKRNTNTLFDVTIESHDRAETFELVGTHILSQLKQIPYCMEISLYRDDGLEVLEKSPQKIENKF